MPTLMDTPGTLLFDSREWWGMQGGEVKSLYPVGRIYGTMFGTMSGTMSVRDIAEATLTPFHGYCDPAAVNLAGKRWYTRHQ